MTEGKIQWHPAFYAALQIELAEEERKMCMCEALKEIFAEDLADARREGRCAGKVEGRKEGEARFGALTRFLLKEKKYDVLERASLEMEYREKLYEEYEIV